MGEEYSNIHVGVWMEMSWRTGMQSVVLLFVVKLLASRAVVGSKSLDI
jgi:hypothetical protein